MDHRSTGLEHTKGTHKNIWLITSRQFIIKVLIKMNIWVGHFTQSAWSGRFYSLFSFCIELKVPHLRLDTFAQPKVGNNHLSISAWFFKNLNPGGFVQFLLSCFTCLGFTSPVQQYSFGGPTEGNDFLRSTGVGLILFISVIQGEFVSVAGSL